MKRSVLLEKRKMARELRERGWSIHKIARHLGANWESVKRWLAMNDRDLDHDRRGRVRGKRLKYDETQKRRVLEIRRRLMDQGDSYGAEAVARVYAGEYGGEVSTWFVNTVTREARLEDGERECRGGERSIEFPDQQLTRFGKVTMVLDFVGVRRNRARGRTACFLFARYLAPVKLGVLAHVNARSCDEVKKTMRYVWMRYIKPDVIRMNLHPAFGAGISHPRTLGAWPLALLNLGIVPFYSTGEGPAPMEMDRLDNMFSKSFAHQLQAGSDLFKGMCIENFYMEYLDSRDRHKIDRLKVPSPPFNRWNNGADLENRDVNRMAETRVFFLSRWSGGPAAQ
jgi:transposase